jgi:quercetin dioxygenase-like cupin family protein
MESLNDNLRDDQREADSRKITFFSAKDTTDLKDFMPDRIMPSAATREGVNLWEEKGFRTGATTKVLVNLPGFSLVYAWFKSGLTLPVHSHDSDCLYYVVAGEAILGSRTLRAGDGFFVPADAYYTYKAGPEGIEILEFRHANQINMRYRDSKPEYWTQMAEKIAAKQGEWKTETLPRRESTGKG